jgi:hypothetical protein
MIKRKKIEGATVSYKDDPRTRDLVYEYILKWFLEHESFSGECIRQNDEVQMDAPDLLGDLADDVFEFDVEQSEE